MKTFDLESTTFNRWPDGTVLACKAQEDEPAAVYTTSKGFRVVPSALAEVPTTHAAMSDVLAHLIADGYDTLLVFPDAAAAFDWLFNR